MALPHLVKYIYNNGTDEVIRRGKKIHATGNVELVEHDDLLSAITFRVKDDAYSTYYKVYINKFRDPKTLSIRCGCPYNLGEICRHEAAALLQLQELLDKNLLGEKLPEYNQRHTVIKMKQLELKLIKLLTAPDSYTEAENYLRSNKANITEAANERLVAELDFYGSQYRIVIQKNEERNFDTSCSCHEESAHPLCTHKTIVLLQLLNAFGPNYFDTIRNLDKEKNKLLALYGYSLDDDIEGKFEFILKDGKPFLRVLDTSIKRVVMPAQSFRPTPVVQESIAIAEEYPVAEKQKYKLGVVLSYNAHQYPYIQVDVVQGEADEHNNVFTGKVEKLDLTKFINTEVFDENDKTLIQQLRKLLPGEVSRYLNRNSPFSGIWENIIQQHDDELPEETRYLIAEYLQPKYKKIFSDLAESGFVFFSATTQNFPNSKFGEG
jgi:non-specific serine/threonine protein kinase